MSEYSSIKILNLEHNNISNLITLTDEESQKIHGGSNDDPPDPYPNGEAKYSSSKIGQTSDDNPPCPWP